MRKNVSYSHGAYIVNGAFYQCDLDFPAAARSIGWRLAHGNAKCQHRGTDGTVDCPDCGKRAMAFIASAVAYLDRHAG